MARGIKKWRDPRDHSDLGIGKDVKDTKDANDSAIEIAENLRVREIEVGRDLAVGGFHDFAEFADAEFGGEGGGE